MALRGPMVASTATQTTATTTRALTTRRLLAETAAVSQQRQ